jgi:hypothetical protein
MTENIATHKNNILNKKYTMMHLIEYEKDT